MKFDIVAQWVNALIPLRGLPQRWECAFGKSPPAELAPALGKETDVQRESRPVKVQPTGRKPTAQANPEIIVITHFYDFQITL